MIYLLKHFLCPQNVAAENASFPRSLSRMTVCKEPYLTGVGLDI